MTTEANVSSMADKHQRLQEIAHHLWCMWGGAQGIHDACNLGHIKEEDCQLLWMVLELYPAWLEKWREGRMSITEILANPPEKVEAEIDSYIQRLQPYADRVDPGITFLTLAEARVIPIGTTVNLRGKLYRIEDHLPLTDVVVWVDGKGESGFWYASVLTSATLDIEACPCAYCGKWRTRENWARKPVWQNGQQVNLPFCKDGRCAINFEMGAEG